jgi:hypothetical protein
MKRKTKNILGWMILILVCFGTMFFISAWDEKRSRTEATKLAKQYVSERSELYREQDECDAEDFCCIERSSLRRRVLSLEFESECYPKFGKAACDRALVNLPEFDTAGVI